MPGTRRAPHTDRDLVDWAAATWLTLHSCQPLADEETGATIREAMACLDLVAQLAQMLGVEEQRLWLADVTEIDGMADAILDRLRAKARAASK
jgi:hypothetical protein